MTGLVPIALFGWPVIVLALFAALPARRAVIAAFILGWLFLPVAGYSFQGWPDYDKTMAIAAGVVLGVLLFDAGRLLRLTPSWVDLPVLAWCLVPLISSIANELGAYEGVSAAMQQTLMWGVPYLMGRMYFADLRGLRELAVGVFIGGLIYVPLCLLEVRLSPQLHNWLYGYHQHSFSQHIRFGGYRPKVFMQHGLAVAMWMTTATLVGAWLWRSGALRRLWGAPMPLLLAPLLAATVLCRSVGPLALLMVGLGVMLLARNLRTGLVVLCLALVPVVYIGARTSGAWDGSHLVHAAAAVVSDESRIRSLSGRLEQEDVLGEHALRQPVLGWGGWGRNRPARMGFEQRDTATDGLWIIAFGQHGFVGLSALFATLLLPVALLCVRMPGRGWWARATAPAAALAVALALSAIDSLLNAMVNPVFLLAAGGLGGLAVSGLRRRRDVAVPRPREAAMPVGRGVGVVLR